MKQRRGSPDDQTPGSRPAKSAIAVLVPVARSAETGSASPEDAWADVPALILLPLRPPGPAGPPGAPGPAGTARRVPWRLAGGVWRRPGLARDCLRPLTRGGRRLARQPWSLALVLVLAVQAGLSLWLAGAGAAPAEEGGCLSAGRLELAHWLHGAPLPPLAGCLSGAPVSYPVLGALASGLGGLAAARVLSLVFVLAATVLLRATAARRGGAAAGFWAAAVWALLAPTIRLGAFATPGAMALFLLALAAWLAVGARDCRFPAGCTLAAAVILLLANATEYATVLFDPVVAAGAALAGSPSRGSRAAWRRDAFLVFGLAIAVTAVLRAGDGQYLSGLRALASPGRLAGFGAWLAAIAVGCGMAGLVARARRRRPLLAAELAIGLTIALVPLAVVGARQAAGAPAAPRPAAAAVLSGAPGSYLGVYEPGGSSSYRAVGQFASATGERPDIVMSYADWLAAFPVSFAARAYRHHAVPLLQLQPAGVSLAAIAGGRYDAYLTSYASAVRAYRHPVVIGFGNEMNGTWFSWGWRHASPAAWVAAWRHIVELFRQRGVTNVTWLWTVNVTEPGLGPIQAWWPGASYVTWVGIDGYYYVPTDSFRSVFGPTLAIIRQITGKPVLLSAVAVGPVAGQAAKIPGLFAGIRAARLLGLVWYDAVQHDGLYHQDWRLEDDHGGLAAFRSAARRMRAG